MRTDLFDFDLPEDRIALEPASPRDSARLLVVRPHIAPAAARQQSMLQGVDMRMHGYDADSGLLEDRRVRDLPGLLRPGDALVFNDTRVIRAALTGERVRGEA